MDLHVDDGALRSAAGRIREGSIRLSSELYIPALESYGSLAFPSALSSQLHDLQTQMNALVQDVASTADATLATAESMVGLEESLEEAFKGARSR
ncbi:hypothetical protein [Schaalia hyovaginalis]|uniref:Uncharacterized protein n=1 Tax=Schaalia hyovaginalis TaxID=29316 RepID=A0A923E7K4_9ACTO|nr:hypothetical protein [Schaalia hyovaginalis]MBB6335545.1 hypothetical protein [Schaalia hyovaginalis]MDY2669242.1 hypothetical protein [Schaalia hyovaginalis]MDY6213539.1 hypothetical protein [Schaalia hyovaginalis]